jgi:hypothetical protein
MGLSAVHACKGSKNPSCHSAVSASEKTDTSRTSSKPYKSWLSGYAVMTARGEGEPALESDAGCGCLGHNPGHAAFVCDQNSDLRAARVAWRAGSRATSPRSLRELEQTSTDFTHPGQQASACRAIDQLNRADALRSHGFAWRDEDLWVGRFVVGLQWQHIATALFCSAARLCAWPCILRKHPEREQDPVRHLRDTQGQHARQL